MFYICCYNLVIFMDKNELKKHLDFCMKYPETVMMAESDEKMVQYIIDKNITPVVDYMKVGRMAELYKNYPNVFFKFKDIIKDWNDMIYEDANKNY